MGRNAARLAAVAAFLVTLGACGGSPAPAPQTDIGITSNSILLGTTNALSGPAAAYGTIAHAEDAYFTYVNNQGGVNGRKITFKIQDDAYNPANTVPLTKGLVEQDQVFAMFSGLGTQDQTSVRDYLNSHGLNATEITAVGFGSTRPLTEERKPDGSDSPEGRRFNRRVEIVVRPPR